MSWWWNWRVGGMWSPAEWRLCYRSCKMVYYPVSNCTWKETSNLYEKCLRLPAHPVIHARSVSVMLDNKRRSRSLEKRHLPCLQSLRREALKCHFLKWTDHYHLKSWGLWDWVGGRKTFSFDLTGLWNAGFKGEAFCCDCIYASAKITSWNRGCTLKQWNGGGAGIGTVAL